MWRGLIGPWGVCMWWGNSDWSLLEGDCMFEVWWVHVCEEGGTLVIPAYYGNNRLKANNHGMNLDTLYHALLTCHTGLGIPSHYGQDNTHDWKHYLYLTWKHYQKHSYVVGYKKLTASLLVLLLTWEWRVVWHNTVTTSGRSTWLRHKALSRFHIPSLWLAASNVCNIISTAFSWHSRSD